MSWTGFGRRGGGGFHPDRDRWQQDQDNQKNQANQALDPSDRSESTTPRQKDYHNRRPLRSPRPPPPISSIIGKANVVPRRMFSATNQAQNQNHPDDLLNGIPEHQKSVADFNWNSPHQPPYRDVPSALLAAITEPQRSAQSDPGPNWRALLSFYQSPNAIHGLVNLQDLYLYVTRVGIPNAVVDNRRTLLHFYLLNPEAPEDIKIRYDRWPGAYDHQDGGYISLTSSPQASPPNDVPVHSIFRDYSTPPGALFEQWLRNPINVPQGRVPLQMQHRASVLDGYINEDEATVRQIATPALLDRTERVLRLYWWLWMANRRLVNYQDRAWAEMEREFL